MKDAKPKLTPKQEKFVEVYVATGNATEAARTAGYSGSDDSLRSIGHQNLGKPLIADRVRARRAERLGEVHTSQRRVFGTLASQMHADLSQFFDDDGHFIGMARVRQLGLGPLIKSLQIRSYYRGDETRAPLRVEVVRIELHSAQAAADKLATLLDMKRPATVDPEHEDLISLIKQRYSYFVTLSGLHQKQYGIAFTRVQLISCVADAFAYKDQDVIREILSSV